MRDIPTELAQELFQEAVDKLQVYGLDRLTAMNSANECGTLFAKAYQHGIGAGEGTEEVLKKLETMIEKHSADRKGDPTYDTARTVMLDLLADLKKALRI